MKAKNSLRNAIAAFISNFVSIIIGLIAQKMLINILGIEYVGLNGLFTNIISMLAIVELGFSSAIIYNLYAPVAKNDYHTIRVLLQFYKRVYRVIACVVLLIGFAIMPFLTLFIADVEIDVNVYVVYALFIVDVVCSYLLSYRRSILYADQKNYVISLVHIFYLIGMNVLQLTMLIATKNYYLYLAIKILFRIIENSIIHYAAGKKYQYLSTHGKEKLPTKTRKDIFKKIRGLFLHKVGTFIVLGTDNLVISRYFGLVTVGFYSNYYIIINALNMIFGQAISAVTPSIGHLLIEEDQSKNFQVFRKIRFIVFWISCFSGIGLLVISQPFIELWLGQEYVLGLSVVAAIVFNYFQKMMRYSYSTFKDAAGIYYEDRFVPIIESVINIIVSVILAKVIGLPGVFIGTIVSGLALWCYSYPKFVYKGLFGRSYTDYAKETIGYIVCFLLIASATAISTRIFSFSDTWLQLLFSLSTVIVIPNVLIILLFFNNDNFKYCAASVKRLLNKIRKHFTKK